MTTRPDGLDEDALSAYLRNEATPEDAARIEAAAENDPALCAELALMGKLKDTLAATSEGADMREFGWRRLEAEIAKETAMAPPPRSTQNQVWRVAALFLGALVLGQSAYIAFAPGVQEEPAYRTVSQEPTFTFSLAVGFASSTEMGAVQSLLNELDARIVDGPGAIGLYRLAFDTEAARDAARETLASSPLVDLIAEE